MEVGRGESIGEGSWWFIRVRILRFYFRFLGWDGTRFVENIDYGIE